MSSRRYGWLSAAVLLLALSGCGGDGGPADDAGTDAATDEDAGSFGGVMHCEEDADCSDGLACTADSCVLREGEGRVCSWTVAEDACLVDSACWGEGDRNPADPCEQCDLGAPTEWTPVEEGASCDDGDPCTTGTVCTDGACTGEAVSCDDGNDCTVDECVPGEGCSITPVADGEACDDGNACTEGDACLAGECSGATVDCDDGNECTDDSCDPESGCLNEANTAECEDGDPCTVDEVCSEGVCGGGVPNTCEDFNGCTIDHCDPEAGCQHLPKSSPCCVGESSICDDGDPCTTDVCDPDTADCSYEHNTAPCDDSDVCTTDDVCSAGECGGTPISCDDGNDCTVDQCNVTAGCFYTALDGDSCDDGRACSTGDSCVMGVCEADTSMCFCTPTFDDAAKLTSLVVGADETAGEALDIDADGSLDNALAPLGSFVNEPLQDAISTGSLMLLFEYADFAPGPFTLALLSAQLDPANASCDYQTATCDYHAERDSLDPDTCEPTITLDATRTGDLVTAGGSDASVPLSIPLDATSTLELTLYMVNLEMTVTVTSGEVVAFDALLGGAVRETDLNAAIRSLDPESLPLPPDELVDLLETLAPNDIDTDGDGSPDAKSMGLKLAGIDGVLTGAVTP